MLAKSTTGPTPAHGFVSVSIDTEEDDWGSYETTGARLTNIDMVPELQERMDRWGVRPTYFVNYPPLATDTSAGILRELAEMPNVEIGAHCHPWNTPPLKDEGRARSMMSALPEEVNRAKVGTIAAAIEDRLRVQPKTFRAGKWAFGPSVARVLSELGFRADSSVTPLMNWLHSGGPDFTAAPRAPYLCDPDDPLAPVEDGSLVQLPVTVGFTRGSNSTRRAQLRFRLEHSPGPRLGVTGLLDRTSFLARRWLSPESSDGATLVRLAQHEVEHGAWFLNLTFHSSALLPGATPFVRTASDRHRFLEGLEQFFHFCVEAGLTFKTLDEVASCVVAGTNPTPLTDA